MPWRTAVFMIVASVPYTCARRVGRSGSRSRFAYHWPMTAGVMSVTGRSPSTGSTCGRRSVSACSRLRGARSRSAGAVRATSRSSSGLGASSAGTGFQMPRSMSARWASPPRFRFATERHRSGVVPTRKSACGRAPWVGTSRHGHGSRGRRGASGRRRPVGVGAGPSDGRGRRLLWPAGAATGPRSAGQAVARTTLIRSVRSFPWGPVRVLPAVDPCRR